MTLIKYTDIYALLISKNKINNGFFKDFKKLNFEKMI